MTGRAGVDEREGRRADFVTVEMPPDEWREYMVREYNALADRYELSLAEIVSLKDALERAEQQIESMRRYRETQEGLPPGTLSVAAREALGRQA